MQLEENKDTFNQIENMINLFQQKTAAGIENIASFRSHVAY